MNMRDILSIVAPGFALKRARQRLELAMYERAYEAARVRRGNAGWNTTGSSANTEISSSLTMVRNRLRALLRDDEWASSAVAKITAYTIGTGITITPANKSEAKRWRAWARSKRCDWDDVNNFYGIQRLVTRALHESGEVLIRKRTNPDRAPGEIPLQLQVLESDHLDESKNGPMENGTFVVMGVKFDRSGKRLGYYLFENHPGDSAIRMTPTLESKFVPADDVIHVFDRTRPEQVRGMSRLAVSVARIRDLGDYQHALLVKKKIEACFVMHIATENPSAAGALTGESTDGKRHETLRPGMIMYGSPGDQVSFGMPSHSSDEGYTKTQLHAISAGTGVPYYMLTGDLESVNYTSSRAGKIDFQMMIEQDQWLVLIPQFLQRVREWWRMFAAIGGQQIGAEDDQYTMPKRYYTDPLKDVQATLAAIEGNTDTISQAIRETGRDPEEVFDERKKEMDLLKSLGLIQEPDPAQTQGEGGTGEVKPKTPAKDAAARLLKQLEALGEKDE